MSNKKLSQLPDNAAPSADGTSVAAVTAATVGGVTTYTNQIVTVRNIVKAGVQAGGVGLATVATTGSYTNLTNVPASFPPSSHNHDDRYYTETETDTLLAGKQATGNYATLDGSGRVPAAQLPSYVDDVEEYANLASLPNPGEQGKIYVALDTNKIYRWSATTYLEISPSPGSTDSVAEGSVNLYYTNARAAAAAPVQSVAGKTGTVSLAKADVGLGSVDDTSDLNKPISTATQTALNAKVDSTDARLTDSREWSAATATQAEAEAGTSTTRLAFTPQRIFQAIAAWWAGSAAKTKLDGIATGATANATDAQLRDRATHTGTQAATTITGLATVATTGAYANLTGTPSLGTIASQNASAVAITGGTINGTSIGATTASTGAFTTVTTTGNVGIGTTTPVHRLDVSGQVRATGGQDPLLVCDATNNQSNSIWFTKNGLPRWYVWNSDATNLFNIGNPTVNPCLSITAAGNIGIGTASPASRLHVTGGTITTDDNAINPTSIGAFTLINFTGNRTLALTDAGRLLVFTGTSAANVTIPADASVNFPVGTRIRLLHANVGSVDLTVLPWSGTPTIRSDGSGFGPFSRHGFTVYPGEAELTKIDANLWVITGDCRQR